MRRTIHIAMLVALAGCNEEDAQGGGDGADTQGGGSTAGSAATDGEGSDTDTDVGEGTGEETGEPLDPGNAVDDARRELPTYFDLHFKVIFRTCTPNEGVCHNDKEYPDLHTPQSMLGSLSQPCNIALDDPMDTFNGCEAPGDVLQFLYGSNAEWSSEIGWIEIKEGMGVVVLHLRDAIPNAMDDPGSPEGWSLSRQYDGEVELLTEFYDAEYEAGSSEVTLRDWADLGDERQSLLRDELKLGDPNRDGVFGADDAPFLLVTPGAPDASYLFGRLLGTVPGTPMPLANQPLSSAEVLALTCWIEGLDAEGADDVYAAIDYDNCEAARDFGEPQPDSGHTLSGDVQPIFDQFCTAAGCHNSELPASGLDLTAENAREELLESSTQDSMTHRVVPGNPTNSYLIQKLRGKGASGVQMPRTSSGEGDPLSEDRLRTVEDWIIAGAPDD